MKLKLDRIISIATLLASLTAIVLVLKKPAPVQPQAGAPAAAIHPATQVDSASSQLPQSGSSSSPSAGLSSSSSAVAAPAAIQGQPYASTTTKPAAGQAAVSTILPSAAATISNSANANSNLPNSDQLSAILAKTLGEGSAPLTPDSNVGSGEPNIKDQQVTMDGDVVHGKFLTEINGKDTWITISGHVGEKDGYATFDPTEFKVGDIEVPVSAVNPLLQQKLTEERDRLKIPDNSR